MNSNKKIVLLLSIFMVVFSLVVQAGDFSFTQGKGINSVCPRATGLFTDNIVNSGEEQKFTVNVDGSAAAWSTAVPNGFHLLPGEEKTVYTYVTPFEDTKPGNYEVSVIVTTPDSVKKLTHPVVVKECYDAGLTAAQATKNTCPNTKAVAFETIIKNLGEYPENYKISVQGPIADWIKLSEDNINIDRGGIKSVFAYVDVPSDALGDKATTVAKEFTIVVEGLSRGSDTLKSITYKLNVDPCYNFDISAQQNSYSLCEAATQNAPVAIKNKGTVENTYNIKITNGPEWTTLSKTSVILAPGQSEVVNVVLNPPYKIEGKFPVELEVSPVKGDLNALDSFEINVRKCHSVKLDIVKNEDKLCNDVYIQYDFIVSNDGEVNKQYKLEATGDFKWLDQDTVSVNAGDKKTVMLNVRPTVDAAPGDHIIKVKATALDESAVSAEDEIKITNIDIAKCYEPELIIIPDDVVVYYDSAATIPVQVKNKGERRAKYELGLSGSAVNFVQISPAALSVDPLDAEVSSLYIAPSAQVTPKQYEITVAVRLGDTTILKSKQVNIRVTENKEEATPGLTGAVIATPSEESPSLWTRIKNWWNNLFKKDEQVGNITETVITTENITEPTQTQENTTPPATQPAVQETTPEVVEPQSSEAEELTIVRRQMGEGDVYLYSLNNEQHSIKVEKVEANKTSLTFSSDPVNVEINVGETKEIDINGDGINDVKATLNKIENGKLDMTYEVIEQTKVEATAEGTGLLSRVWQGILNYKYYILAGLGILIVIIVISKYHKKIVDFFEEDAEEEEKKEEHPKEEEKKKK